MVAVIYNCKACKVGKRVEYPNRDKALNSYWRDGGAEGRVFPGSYVHYAKRGGRYNVGDGVCSDCGRAMSWGFLQAWTVPSVKCDARCEHARGFKCDCSCGGEKHGAGWSLGASGLFSGLLLEAA